MKKFTPWLIVLAVITFAASGLAQDRNTRQGFFIGFGLGGGGLHIVDEDRGGAMLNIVIGGGLNEKILFMGEIAASNAKINDVFVGVSSAMFAAQIFLDKGWYVRPAIGTATGHADDNTVQIESESGFSTSLTAGYEFRMGKSFALSPEGKFGYAYIDDDNIMQYGLLAHLRWYI